MFTERMQVLLTAEQRSRLERVAASRRVSIGAVVREAIDAYTAPRRRSREDAVTALFGLEAPVDDWPTMKAEILEGA
ncbi:MAG: hypothetical protein ACRDYA_18605 [Egibacteraceae bacterium]